MTASSSELEIRAYRDTDEQGVIALWHRAGVSRPWNDPVRDIERKLRVQRELFLVGVVAGSVVATAMAGYDGHRGWIYYVAVDPEHQGRGAGTLIMRAVEQALEALGCQKINVQVRRDNAAAVRFYESLGYGVEDNIPLGKRL